MAIPVVCKVDSMTQDRWLFIILGAIIGILFSVAFLMKTEPVEVQSIEWRERTIVDSVPDTIPFYITTPNETIYIDSTTPLLSLPTRVFSKTYKVPVGVNKDEAEIPVDVSARYKGLLYNIDVATQEGYKMQVITPSKPDWKWYAVCFLGGLVTAKLLD
jgi:hypothetical protein